jgi:hypothetical protein
MTCGTTACRTRRCLAQRRERKQQLLDCRAWLDEWVELGRRGEITAQQLATEVRLLLEDLDALVVRARVG